MGKNLDILFLGRLFPKIKGAEIRRKATADMQDAANILQWNLINGFLDNGVSHIHAVSLLPVDSWPKHYKDPFISHDIEYYDERCSFETVSFCNITYIKQVLSAHACDRAVRRWAKEHSGRRKVIVCYSANNVLMRAVAAAKKADPDIESVQIIADITEFVTNAELSKIRELYMRAQVRKNDEFSNYIDKYVLLTELMKNKLGIEKPYIVMEGIAPYVPDSCCDIERTNNLKTVLYTGSMNKKYGILELLKAFTEIPDPDYRLLLCGLGNAQDVISEYCRADKRIEFLGKVAHDEVIKLQKTATVLVNPRQNNEEFTKYSFPSKNLEYLSSGIPLVAYKLDGIPDEYDDYINYVENNRPEALAAKLKEICELSKEERIAMGARAREFVLREKNSTKQTKKILDLLGGF